MALIRFGLGRRGDQQLPADPRAWLLAQLDGPGSPQYPDGLPDAAAAFAAMRQRRMMEQAGNTRIDPKDDPVVELMNRDLQAECAQWIGAEDSFRERLVMFWANHFTVSRKNGDVRALAGSFVREAIRPHVNGGFGELLLAVMRHPAMLIYLNNDDSFGPGSQAGQRRNKGLNENLGRECLELHTLSPAAGYTQADVTAMAAILTGWSVQRRDPNVGFRFMRAAHQPGAKMLLGHEFPEGEQGGIDALAFLASHPATAAHIALKLARHFVADDPPPALVARLTARFLATGGDLPAVMQSLIESPEAWPSEPGKLRPPVDFVCAGVRALAPAPWDAAKTVHQIDRLGQPVWGAPSPKGWPDLALDWTDPAVLLRRVEYAYQLGAIASNQDVAHLTDVALGPYSPAPVRAAVANAGSRREAVTLLFSSPAILAALMIKLARRALLLGMPALAFAAGMRSAFAYAPTDRRLVVVLLRGAMDGMAAVAPYGDPRLANLRGELLLPEPGQADGLLDLGGKFGLHPSLGGLHAMYGQGDLLIWHAVAAPYRSRSHFDAQDMMESGAAHRLDSGWLNRVAGTMPRPAANGARPLVAGFSMPLLMEGKVPVSSWAPDDQAGKMPVNLWTMVAALAAGDPVIGPAIEEGLASRSYAQGVVNGTMAPQAGDLARYAGPAGQLLAAPDGPRIAALEISGWDTHQAQKPRLAQTLRQLDQGMVALKAGLGAAWAKTAVLVITEFGRTARANGTGGTDHGTASVALLLGGAVAGGRVAGTWPGLGDGQLFENRDLAPTTDMWAVAKGVLREHMGLDARALAEVFPGSEVEGISKVIKG